MVKISEKKILETIEKALELKKGCLTLNTTRKNEPKWDSLGHISVLSSLDDIFDGRIAGIEEMGTAKSIRKILWILEKNSLV